MDAPLTLARNGSSDSVISSNSVSVTLEGLSTAVPPHKMPQQMVKTLAKQMLGEGSDRYLRLASIMQNAGVETRYLARPPIWFAGDHDFQARNDAYLDVGVDLFAKVCLGALKNANLSPQDIDCIVTVSSTGVATPTLDARVMQKVGFRSDVNRVPVFGLGCAAGVTGMSIAARLARGNPGSRVLLVAIELCSLAFNTDKPSKADIVSAALFGDGAAAVCLCSQPGKATGGIQVGQGVEHLWRDTLDNMGWDVNAKRLGIILDKSIPNFVQKNYRIAANQALETAGLKLEDITRFICHPGSVKVVDAIEIALELEQNVLEHERAVMKDFGNMSAPTVLFILERVLKEAEPGQYMMASLGPGFTASFLPLNIAKNP